MSVNNFNFGNVIVTIYFAAFVKWLIFYKNVK